jgi:hypothetical protein
VRKATKFSPKQFILIAFPALISFDSAIANHPLGKGGGSFDPICLSLRARLIADRLPSNPTSVKSFLKISIN